MFLIITPLIIIYANGYQLGKNLKLEKTGMLIIETNPSEATIYLNDKVQQNIFKKIFSFDDESHLIKTPAKIKNLKAGKYELKLELKDYWTWKKEIEIESGKTVFLENIILFKKELPSLLFDKENIKNVTISNNKKYLSVTSDTDTSIINLISEKVIKEIKQASSSKLFDFYEQCLWSPLDKKTLISGEICNINNDEENLKIFDLLGQDIENIKWIGEDEFFYKTKNSLNKYLLSTQKNESLINNLEIIDYIVSNNDLYFLEKRDNNTFLSIFDIEKKEKKQEIKIPNSDYKFTESNDNFINLLNTKQNILYLINKNQQSNLIYDSIGDVQKVFWIDNSKLIYINDFEIWTYDASSYKKSLVRRISEKINNISWQEEKNYIIYATKSSINIIDLKKEKNNIIELVNLPEINYFFSNEDGNILYFYAKIGNKEGIYRLSI